MFLSDKLKIPVSLYFEERQLLKPSSMVFWFVQDCNFDIWLRGKIAFTLTLLCYFLCSIFSLICFFLSNIDSVLWRGKAQSQWCGRFCFAGSLSWFARSSFYFLFLRKLCSLLSCKRFPQLCQICHDLHCSVLLTIHHPVSVAMSVTVRFYSAASKKQTALQLRSQRCLVLSGFLEPRSIRRLFVLSLSWSVCWLCAQRWNAILSSLYLLLRKEGFIV